MKSRPNITRISHLGGSGGATRGWWVRVERRGRRVSRFFSDKRHGGARAALKEAEVYLRQELRRLGVKRPQ